MRSDTNDIVHLAGRETRENPSHCHRAKQGAPGALEKEDSRIIDPYFLLVSVFVCVCVCICALVSHHFRGQNEFTRLTNEDIL